MALFLDVFRLGKKGLFSVKHFGENFKIPINTLWITGAWSGAFS